MSTPEPEPQSAGDLLLEVALEAAPDKVWRAVSIPAFREQWLPARDLADPELVVAEPGIAVRYRMRESEPPHVETIVTFEIRPDGTGGTCLTIHQGRAPRPSRMAANMPLACCARAA